MFFEALKKKFKEHTDFSIHIPLEEGAGDNAIYSIAMLQVAKGKLEISTKLLMRLIGAQAMDIYTRGGRFKLSGVPFVVTDIYDFGGHITAVPQTPLLAPFSVFLLTCYHWKAFLNSKIIAKLIKHRLMLTPECCHPHWRDFFFMRDREIVRLKKLLLIANQESENKDMTIQQLRTQIIDLKKSNV